MSHGNGHDGRNGEQIYPARRNRFATLPYNDPDQDDVVPAKPEPRKERGALDVPARIAHYYLVGEDDKGREVQRIRVEGSKIGKLMTA